MTARSTRQETYAPRIQVRSDGPALCAIGGVAGCSRCQRPIRVGATFAWCDGCASEFDVAAVGMFLAPKAEPKAEPLTAVCEHCGGTFDARGLSMHQRSCAKRAVTPERYQFNPAPTAPVVDTRATVTLRVEHGRITDGVAVVVCGRCESETLVLRDAPRGRLAVLAVNRGWQRVDGWWVGPACVALRGGER